MHAHGRLNCRPERNRRRAMWATAAATVDFLSWNDECMSGYVTPTQICPHARGPTPHSTPVADAFEWSTALRGVIGHTLSDRRARARMHAHTHTHHWLRARHRHEVKFGIRLVEELYMSCGENRKSDFSRCWMSAWKRKLNLKGRFVMVWRHRCCFPCIVEKDIK